MRHSPHSIGAAFTVAISALLGALYANAQLILSTDPATAIGITNATLNGAVTRLSQTTTFTAIFEWGLTTAYGHRTPPIYSNPMWPPNTPFPISAVVTGLAPETTHHYRVVVTNTTQTFPPPPPTAVFGQDRTLTTLPPPRPEVTTLDASDARCKSALLNSTVNPMGYASVGWFEWGTDSNYGKTTAVQQLGNANGPVSMSQSLPRLLPGTIYYFQAVATNSFGLTHGEGRALSTLPLPCPTIRASAAEDGSFRIEATSSTEDLIDIEMATSLQPPIQWEFVTNLSSPALFRVPVGGAPQRFYRAVMVGNHAPILAHIGTRNVNEGSTLTFSASVLHPDPEQTVTYRLGTGAPAQANINPATGAFSWTPSEAEGPGNYALTVLVTDDVIPPFEDSETITVTVNEVNQAPVLATIGDKTAMVNTEVTFTASATDADLPPQALTFSLENAPAEAVIGSLDGVFRWTPQTTTPATFTVKVTDSGTPALSDTETITVTPVANQPPVLDPIGNKGINGGYELTFTVTATDPDPGQTLRFSLGPGAPAGATINPTTGAFSWTTPEEQWSFSITVVVTDNGSPPQTDSETITVNVWYDPPVLTGPATVDTGTFKIWWTYGWPMITQSTDGYQLQESTTSATLGFVTILDTTGQGDYASPKTNSLSNKSPGTYWYKVRAYSRQSYSSWSHRLQVTVTQPSSVEVFASRDNALIYSSDDSSWQTTVFANADLGVGNHWEWWGSQKVVAYQSAIWFDVQSQISGRQISRATLRLWPYILPGDRNTSYEASAFAGSWSGSTITFANQPNDYTSAIASVNPPTTTSLPVEWDVTTIVQNWANETWINNGFHLADETWLSPDGTFFRDTSFESLELWYNYDHRPKLIIEFQ